MGDPIKTVHRFCTDPQFRKKIDWHIADLVSNNRVPDKKQIYARNVICQILEANDGRFNYIPFELISVKFVERLGHVLADEPRNKVSATKLSIHIFKKNLKEALTDMKLEVSLQRTKAVHAFKLQYELDACLDFHAHLVDLLHNGPAPEHLQHVGPPRAIPNPNSNLRNENTPSAAKPFTVQDSSSSDDEDFRLRDAEALQKQVRREKHENPDAGPRFYRNAVQKPNDYISVEVRQKYKLPMTAKMLYDADLEYTAETGVCDPQVPAVLICDDVRLHHFKNRAAREQEAEREWVRRGRRGKRPSARLADPAPAHQSVDPMLGLDLDVFTQQASAYQQSISTGNYQLDNDSGLGTMTINSSPAHSAAYCTTPQEMTAGFSDLSLRSTTIHLDGSDSEPDAPVVGSGRETSDDPWKRYSEAAKPTSSRSSKPSGQPAWSKPLPQPASNSMSPTTAGSAWSKPLVQNQSQHLDELGDLRVSKKTYPVIDWGVDSEDESPLQHKEQNQHKPNKKAQKEPMKPEQNGCTQISPPAPTVTQANRDTDGFTGWKTSLRSKRGKR